MFARSLFGMTALLLIASSAGSAADGAAIFKAQCAKCHGDTGNSDTSVGKAMKVPAMAGDAKLQKMSASDDRRRHQGQRQASARPSSR